MKPFPARSSTAHPPTQFLQQSKTVLWLGFASFHRPITGSFYSCTGSLERIQSVLAWPVVQNAVSCIFFYPVIFILNLSFLHSWKKKVLEMICCCSGCCQTHFWMIRWLFLLQVAMKRVADSGPKAILAASNSVSGIRNVQKEFLVQLCLIQYII